MPWVDRLDVVGIVDGAHLHQFAVEMEHAVRSCAFVEVVDVLGNDGDVVVLLKVYKSLVSGIRTGVEQLPAAGVVETVDKGGIGAETVGRGHLHHGIVLPESA